jgi:hypothetical protein
LLTGYTAVYQLQNQPADNSGGVIIDPGIVDPGLSPFPEGGGFIDPGFPPGGGFVDPGISGGGGSAPDVTAQVTHALRAAGQVVALWLVTAVLLCMISLLRGRAPAFGVNVQIAVWATVPFLIFGILRLLFLSAGGVAESSGVSALLPTWAGYTDMPPFTQGVVEKVAGNFTLPALWSVLLVYWGGKYALDGGRVPALFVTVMWVLALILVPVAIDQFVTPESPETAEEMPSGDMMLPDGEMPGIESTAEAEAFPPPNAEQEPPAEPQREAPAGGLG